jgi:hypothetical protein
LRTGDQATAFAGSNSQPGGLHPNDAGQMINFWKNDRHDGVAHPAKVASVIPGRCLVSTRRHFTRTDFAVLPAA